jgi:hypothetical protein
MNVTGCLRMVALAALLVPLAAGAGCAKAHANAQPGGPPLETPPAPPRVVSAVIESEPTVTAAPPIEGPSPRPTPDTRPAPRAERPVAPPATAASETPVPAPPLPADEPPRTLQTTPNAGQAEQRIRGLLMSASRDLSKIDYRVLSVDAQAQYDTAKRFTEQADEALKTKNFVFAEQLADKAAAIAAQLLKR